MMLPPLRTAAYFWPKVAWEGATEEDCWPWMGYRNREGYGATRVYRQGSLSAHRVAYKLTYGDVPDSLHIDHLCRNHACCNPAHLEAVTPRENILRGLAPAAQNAAKTHCVHGHEFTPENTYVRPCGRRACRKCTRGLRRQHEERKGLAA